MAKKKAKPPQPSPTEVVFAEIEKRYGAGAIMLFGDEPREPVETFSTGSMFLDEAIGIGGLPRGRIVEVYGPNASGKTTLCLHVIANAQEAGAKCAFIDAEHALDTDYAEALGVDLPALAISQPDYGEQALEITELLVRSGDFGVVVIDSVAALVPKAEIEGEMGDSHMGLQARLMSQACRKLAGAVAKSGTLLIFINQTRMNIKSGYPTTTGGNALKFYASVRLNIKKVYGGQLKKGDDIVGDRTVVKVVKNKFRPPFKSAEFDIIFGRGIDYGSELLAKALELGVATKAGSWFSLGEDRLGQGRLNVLDRLYEDSDLREMMEAAIAEAGVQS